MTKTGAPRVLLVVTQSERGGAQQYVLSIATDLKRRGADVVLACGQEGPLVDDARSCGIEVRVLPYLVRPIRPLTDLRAIVQLAQFIRTGQFNVVHLNSTKAGIVGRLAARAGGADIVFFTVHGLVLNEPMSKMKFALYWLFERIGAMATTRLIAVAEADRTALIRYRVSSANRIAVIHNGVSLGSGPQLAGANSRRTARAELGFPVDARVVGTVANHYRTKALDVLISSVPLVIKSRPDVLVAIIGDGSERPVLEAQIDRLDLGEQVRLLGALPNARSLLPAFDVFVLPSRKEGLPIALLEAMAAGLPVVVTRVGGMPEVVTQECGRIVSPEDPKALASAIADLLDDPATSQRCGEAGCARIASNFGEQRMLDETARIYAEELHRVGGTSFPYASSGAT